MNESTRLFVQLIVGHHIDGVHDLTPVEIEALLNGYMELRVKYGQLQAAFEGV